MAEKCNIFPSKEKKPGDVYLYLIEKTFQKYIINIPFNEKEEVYQTILNSKSNLNKVIIPITQKE